MWTCLDLYDLDISHRTSPLRYVIGTTYVNRTEMYLAMDGGFGMPAAISEPRSKLSDRCILYAFPAFPRIGWLETLRTSTHNHLIDSAQRRLGRPLVRGFTCVAGIPDGHMI